MDDTNKIKTEWLDEPKRGPGGNPFRYRAWYEGGEQYGYGTTEREAIKDLQGRNMA